MQSLKQENVVPLAVPTRGPTLVTPTAAPSSSNPALVPFPRWQRACDRVSAALLGGETRVVVTGPPGTGKTLLLDHTARVLRAAGWTVIQRLADAAPPPDQPGTVALLIDEADRLSRETLQHVLSATAGPLVLAGLPVVQPRVAGAAQIVLAPLGREEARDYIALWLAQTGRSPANLEAPAMRRIVEISGGVPRLVSTLLGAAAWLADTSDATVITNQHVDEAAALRSCFVAGESDVGIAEARAERTNTPLLVTAAAGLLLLGTGVIIATRFYPAETERAIGAVRQTVARLQNSGAKPTVSAPIKIAAAPTPMSSPAPPALEPPKSLPTPPVAPAAIIPSIAPNPTQIAEPSPPPTPPLPAPPSAVVWQTAPTLLPPIVSSLSAPPSAEPNIAPPDAPTPAQNPAPAVIASAAPLEPIRTLPPETISLLVRRGDEMMAIGDVSAARLLFGRAAEAGDANAMLGMGRTYDPFIMGQANPLLPTDAAEAGRWYRRAADRGSKIAEDLLRRSAAAEKSR